VIPLPSADTDIEAGAQDAPIDEARSALLEAVTEELGDAVVDSHLIAGKDLWLRVTNESWVDAAAYLRDRQRFRFFDWLSAIDWMESPFGRSHDAAVDLATASDNDDESDGTEDEVETPDPSGADGYAGGATRFQVIARVYSLTTHLGVTLKADLGDDLTIGSWTGEYAGADWHEREAFEMFGINFEGHPGLRNLYLPSSFEGHPLRKDFPLLARLVKPWPGIVDVEPMPEVSQASSKPSLTNPEDAS